MGLAKRRGSSRPPHVCSEFPHGFNGNPIEAVELELKGARKAMQIVPVIDLMGGIVVRASGGDRSAYRPVSSPVSSSADITDVVKGFLDIYPFETIYIADLDALMGKPVQWRKLTDLRTHFSSVRFWIDCGAGTKTEVHAFAGRGLGQPVIGTESILSLDTLDTKTVILSLDSRDGVPLGNFDLDCQPEFWPEKIIAMSLGRVGSGAGPDIARVRALAAKRRDVSVYAAGGVRTPADLEALRSVGAAGALVSSALHSGAVDADGIRTLYGKC